MGFFDFFKSKPKQVYQDYTFLGADMHSHLIPGIDDGAKSIEDSIHLISNLKEMGFRKLITTPHIMSDFYKNNPEIILRGLDSVRSLLSKNNISISVEAAAEYYLDADFEKKMKSEKLLSFGKENYLLFELSYLNEPDGVLPVIFEMQMKGYKPVLAHPERYPYWYGKEEKYLELVERGVLLQVNINSLSGHYGPGALKTAENMLKKGIVSFLGTDCHHAGHLNLLKKSLANSILNDQSLSLQFLNSSL